MNTKKLWLSLLLMVAMIASVGAFPDKQDHQLVSVNTTTGNIITGTQEINISYYQGSDSSLLLNHTKNLTSSTKGVYNFLYPLNDFSIFSFTDYVYYRIKIGNSLASPVNFTTVPYSILAWKANNSDYLGGVIASNYLTNSNNTGNASFNASVLLKFNTTWLLDSVGNASAVNNSIQTYGNCTRLNESIITYTNASLINNITQENLTIYATKTSLALNITEENTTMHDWVLVVNASNGAGDNTSWTEALAMSIFYNFNESANCTRVNMSLAGYNNLSYSLILGSFGNATRVNDSLNGYGNATLVASSIALNITGLDNATIMRTPAVKNLNLTTEFNITTSHATQGMFLVNSSCFALKSGGSTLYIGVC